jgi:Xaa-Pro aminopeptidase
MIPPAAALASRHARVREHLDRLGLRALVVVHEPNVAWLTGFTGSTAAALVTPERVLLITDGRYEEVARQTVDAAAEVLQLQLVTRTYDETLVELILGAGDAVGFEAGALTVARHRWWQRAITAAGGSTDCLHLVLDLVEACRAVKDGWEQTMLAEAARRLSAVATGVLADLRPGLREREVALAIELALRRTGFSSSAFDTIVASGPRSALPHARATERTMAAGELVMLDFGGIYGGYCVDLTRTVALGDPGPEARRLHAAVCDAQAAAIRAVVPGRPIAEIDRAARGVLEARGLGEAFSHGTGHGLGLEVHEAPRLSRTHPRAAVAGPADAGAVMLPGDVVPGMVFTVEPGAYVRGFGGVRIEDDVLVTDAGAEVLTSVSRELVVG